MSMLSLFKPPAFRGEHAWLVAYDVSDRKRWRRVFRMLHGYGEWLQLSVFQCRLTRARRERMQADLERLLDPAADHAVIIDLGPADTAPGRIVSIGRPVALIDRAPTVV